MRSFLHADPEFNDGGAELPFLRCGDDRVKKNVAFASGPMASVRLVYNLPIK